MLTDVGEKCEGITECCHMFLVLLLVIATHPKSRDKQKLGSELWEYDLLFLYLMRTIERQEAKCNKDC